MGRRMSTLAAMAAASALLAFAPAAHARNATIEIEIYKAGFIVGGSGGSGTLKLDGKRYPLSIGGVSLGATIGFSKAQLIGTVRNINKPSDIEGTFSAGTAGVAVAGGQRLLEDRAGLERDQRALDAAEVGGVKALAELLTDDAARAELARRGPVQAAPVAPRH